MQQIEAFKRTRFFRLCMEAPYAIAFGCGFLALGVATGISTGAALNMVGLISFKTTQRLQLWPGLLRMSLFNLMLFFGVLSSALKPSFMPLSCICIALKGFAIGFAVKQLHLDYGWGGLIMSMAVVLPALCTLTGLMLCFGQGGTQLAGKQKKEKKNLDALKPYISLTFFLSAAGSILEGTLSQLVVHIFGR